MKNIEILDITKSIMYDFCDREIKCEECPFHDERVYCDCLIITSKLTIDKIINYYKKRGVHNDK